MNIGIVLGLSCLSFYIYNKFISKFIVISKNHNTLNFKVWVFLISEFIIYFTFSTIALKASGLFIAKSAKTLRFKSILLAFILPIN